MQIGGLAILKNRHNCVKAQRYNVRYWYHIGADLVGTIENEYIRNDTNTKLCSVMQMGRLQYHKTFNRV